VVVVGSTGSGKSSLLTAMLNAMIQVSNATTTISTLHVTVSRSDEAQAPASKGTLAFLTPYLHSLLRLLPATLT
jgi:predicted GTPase